MQFVARLSELHRAWFSAHGYAVVSFVARGRSAAVWKLKKGARFFAAKIEHEKSRRLNMLAKEALHLKMANDVGVGPRLVEVDSDAGILIMDFVDGFPLAKWLLACDSNSKAKMKKVLRAAFAQAEKLERAGIDHGQLGGKLHNILVDKKSRVWIIDFEKAGYVRKTRNIRKLRADLFHSHYPVVEKVRAVLGPDAEKLILGPRIFISKSRLPFVP